MLTDLNEFRSNELEATFFETVDDFTHQTSLDTVMFDQDEAVFACCSHEYCSVNIELDDLNRKKYPMIDEVRNRPEKNSSSSLGMIE